jgi:hypothetical protein
MLKVYIHNYDIWHYNCILFTLYLHYINIWVWNLQTLLGFGIGTWKKLGLLRSVWAGLGLATPYMCLGTGIPTSLVSDLVAKSRNKKKHSPSLVLRHVLSMCWVHLAKYFGKRYIQFYAESRNPTFLFRTSLQELNLLPKKCSEQLVAQKWVAKHARKDWRNLQ